MSGSANSRRIGGGVFGVLVLAAAAAACVTEIVLQPDKKSFAKDVTTHYELKYLQWLPDGYDQADKKWPLLVFLHGAGETGNDLDKVLGHGPPKLAAAGRKFPCIVVAPQASHLIWNPLEVNAFVAELTQSLKVDATRVWLTGLSMGGNGTWMAASLEPERYAAIVPICGWGDFVLGRRLKHVPVWAFHGAKDPTIPAAKSQEMVDAVNGAGGAAKLTLYDDLAHDSWTRAYDDPALWEWLFAQQRPAK